MINFSTKLNGSKVLWTNPNPDSNFTEQTITLSSSDYDVLEIFYRTDVTASISFSTKTLKGYGFQLDFNSISNNKWVRRGMYISNTKFSVNNCTWSADSTVHNEQCIPLYIVGYKTGLFD